MANVTHKKVIFENFLIVGLTPWNLTDIENHKDLHRDASSLKHLN